MRVILTVALWALLSGCAINWPRNVSQPEFTWTDTSPGPAADPATQERRVQPKAGM